MRDHVVSLFCFNGFDRVAAHRICSARALLLVIVALLIVKVKYNLGGVRARTRGRSRPSQSLGGVCRAATMPLYHAVGRCASPAAATESPVGAWKAPARARAARAAPEPPCPRRATQPARGGRGKGGSQRGSARARDEVRDRARPEELRDLNTAALGDSRHG